jgi:hypothetical protein
MHDRVKEQLNNIAGRYSQLAAECNRQMPVKNGKKFKYKIGQQVNEMKIYHRWHAKETNFYDVEYKRDGDKWTWTLDEDEITVEILLSNF